MNETVEKKYMPEVSRKEIEELKNTMKAASQKVMADNIERMKKADPNRPEAMKYFDEISNLFGQTPRGNSGRERKGQESYRLHVPVCSNRADFSCRRHSCPGKLWLV